jgi:hypothetical protein
MQRPAFPASTHWLYQARYEPRTNSPSSVRRQFQVKSTAALVDAYDTLGM